MSMNKIPTLILGIGGIGCRIAANINDLLRPEDREHIAIVGMDTNVNDLKQLENRGIRTIQTSDDRKVGEYLQMHPEYMRWFPVNQFTVSRGMLNGAGQIRAISRLAALAAEENGLFIPIKEEIQRIRANRGQSGVGNLTVMVVGSITGGTGAGLFLQMPYYIRKVMKNEADLNIIIRGMFVGPDLTVDVQPSKINRNAVRVNGYTCLKELNALYMLQTHPDGIGKLKVDFHEPAELDTGLVDDMSKSLMDSEYYDESFDLEAARADATVIAKGNPQIPYDYLYLIEGSNIKGGIGNAPLDSVESLAGRMVHTLMFTPVSDNALSVEDNMVLQDMETGGMNRYSSAGLCRLVYPAEQAREYVTLCTVRDLVKEEWLIIDNGHNDEVIQARSLQRTDGQVEIPKLSKSYLDLFAKHVKGEGHLGRLYKEAFVRTETNEEQTRSEIWLEGISVLLQELQALPDVEAARTACNMNPNKMNTYEAAVKESSRIYTALDEYTKLAKRMVTDKPNSLANELFPPSWQSMRSNKDKTLCIYQLLSGVHPLTARYLCYDLLEKMEARYEELEASVAGLNLEEYLQEDFDKKEPKAQNATVALRKLQQKQNPLVGAVLGDANGIKKVRNRLQSMADSQAETITQYMCNSVELAILRVLINRVKALVENYRIFFQGIAAMIQENANRIDALENLNLPLGQNGIYCSKDAFRAMAAEYRNQVDTELPTATKVAIFEKLFQVMADDFSREGKVMTERQKAAYAAKKAENLNGIFHSAVVDTIRTNVIENSSGVVDLTARQALEKQYELDVPDMTFEEYLRDRIEAAMRMAAPMLATTTNAMAQNTETVYIAMHPDCAATEMGEPNAGATQMLYVPQACEATDGVRAKALLDEAFSPYEITCFKARYKFSIEDLVKYGPNSENAKAYHTRISNLGKMPVNTGDPDDFKTIVNPHLDRYWHEEAYIPAIYESERKRSRVNTYKAFIYAIGLDCLVRMTDDSALDEQGEPRKSWYEDGSSTPIKVRGGRIGGSFIDLYQALPFNGRVKQNILQRAKISMQTDKKYYTAQELMERILEIPFIEDLIQPSIYAESDEGNILDILMQMRDAMSQEEWENLFLGLKEALWEYCAFLLDSNERLVNNAVKKILAEMLANSTVASKEETDMTYTERALIAKVMAIGKEVYRKRN